MIARASGAAILLALSLAGCSEAGPQSCRIGRVVDLPLLQGSRLPAVEASLDGQKVVVYIDTGAAISVVARKAADHFNLRSGPEDGSVRLDGVGGTVFAPLVKVPHLGLGNGIARDLELPVAGDLGGPVQGMPVLGVFGADFLSNYDVDLDLPGHHFAMYRLQSCGNTMQPLDPPSFSIPFDLTETKVLLELKLNGKPVTGILDSGATGTLIPIGVARQVGVGPDAMVADRRVKTKGIDESALETQVHRFGSLEIGDETMRNFRFGVADSNIDDMLLGDDFLRHNHVWISYPLRRLYIRPVTADQTAAAGAAARTP